MSQKEIVKKLCQDQPERWFMSYEFVKVNTKYGWLGTSGDRRARDLVEEKILERKDEGQYTKFRLAPNTPFLASLRPEVLQARAQDRLL